MTPPNDEWDEARERDIAYAADLAEAAEEDARAEALELSRRDPYWPWLL